MPTTYRKEREQHPCSNHDPVLPRLSLLLRTAALTASAWFPFLQREDTTLSQVAASQVKQDRTRTPVCTYLVAAAPRSTQTATWTGPTSPIQRYGLEPCSSLQGQMKPESSVFIFTQLLVIRLHLIRSIMIQQTLAVTWHQIEAGNEPWVSGGQVFLWLFSLSHKDLFSNLNTRKWPFQFFFPSCKAAGSPQ